MLLKSERNSWQVAGRVIRVNGYWTGTGERRICELGASPLKMFPDRTTEP